MNDEPNLFEPIDELGPPRQKALSAAMDPYAEEPFPSGAGFFSHLEILLKRPGSIRYALRQGAATKPIWTLVLASVLCLALYGLVAGSLSGGRQLWAAPLKLVAGSLLAGVICLPSLYVFLCLAGIDARLREIVGSLAAMTALTAALLIGFAPVVWVFSQSTDSVALMTTLHLAFWAVSVGLGGRLLRRFLAGAAAPARIALWLVVYGLVSLQMMTALRPIIGEAETLLPTEKRFFLEHFGDVLGGSGQR